MVVLDGNCAVGCGSGTDFCVGWQLCCSVWVWNGIVVLDGNCAVGCGSRTVYP
jgi:hypothetical protein